jgi:hypothetical protein
VTQSFLAFFGTRRLRGGWMIKEQMIINASSYDKAWAMAEARCYPGEEVLDVVNHVPVEDVVFWGV